MRSSSVTHPSPPTPSTHHPLYTVHPSLQDRLAFPSPFRNTSTPQRRISTPDYPLKPDQSHTPSSNRIFSSSRRRASTPDTTLASPYDSRPYHSTSRTPESRITDAARFPGPLHIPPSPRFLASPTPSPRDVCSPASTLINSPSHSHRSYPSPSPPPIPSWRDSYPSERLPPIRPFHSSLRGDDLPHLSSARWDDHPIPLKPSPPFLDPPSPTPSSPDIDQVTLPNDPSDGLSFLPGSTRYQYPSRLASPIHRGEHRGDTTARFGGEPRRYKPRHLDLETDGHVNKDPAGHRVPSILSPVEHPERHDGSSRSRRNPSTLHARGHHHHHTTTTRAPHRSHSPCDRHDDDSEAYSPTPSRSKSKFGIRKGTRFFCTYVSPLTGERCDTWDKGWTVYATLVRHAEIEHAHEELSLLLQGELSYDAAQIVTSREKKERVEENLARTGRCPDCGTVFSSRRRDSLSRHRQTNACEKAQKRGRPPTKFPKKPKGPSFQVLEVDSADETPFR